MILKFQHNLRINKDGNVSFSGEQIATTEEEAEEAGREFARLRDAFFRGMGESDQEPPGA